MLRGTVTSISCTSSKPTFFYLLCRDYFRVSSPVQLYPIHELTDYRTLVDSVTPRVSRVIHRFLSYVFLELTLFHNPESAPRRNKPVDSIAILVEHVRLCVPFNRPNRSFVFNAITRYFPSVVAKTFVKRHDSKNVRTYNEIVEEDTIHRLVDERFDATYTAAASELGNRERGKHFSNDIRAIARL